MQQQQQSTLKCARRSDAHRLVPNEVQTTAGWFAGGITGTHAQTWTRALCVHDRRATDSTWDSTKTSKGSTDRWYLQRLQLLCIGNLELLCKSDFD